MNYIDLNKFQFNSVLIQITAIKSARCLKILVLVLFKYFFSYSWWDKKKFPLFKNDRPVKVTFIESFTVFIKNIQYSMKGVFRYYNNLLLNSRQINEAIGYNC